MKKVGMSLVALLVIVLAASAGFQAGAARADLGSCDPGWSLVLNGQIPEADLNADGYTCEVAAFDQFGQPAVLGVDNVPYDPATTAADPQCSDSGVPTAWPTGTPPDKNGDGTVCTRTTGSGAVQIHDDHVNNGGGKKKK